MRNLRFVARAGLAGVLLASTMAAQCSSQTKIVSPDAGTARTGTFCSSVPLTFTHESDLDSSSRAQAIVGVATPEKVHIIAVRGISGSRGVLSATETIPWSTLAAYRNSSVFLFVDIAASVSVPTGTLATKDYYRAVPPKFLLARTIRSIKVCS